MQNIQLNTQQERQHESTQTQSRSGGATMRRRGFASMDREKQRRIASMGGKAAHQQGVAHEFTPDEARVAGRLGGRRSHSGSRHPEQQREHAMEQ